MHDTYRYTVDFGEVKHYIEIHEVLKRDLELPDYYGGNAYALWDCLTDQLLSGTTFIEIHNHEIVMKSYADEWREILKIFKRAKHAYADKYANCFFVTVVHKNGFREEIE